jgi:hypothetical protein
MHTQGKLQNAAIRSGPHTCNNSTSTSSIKQEAPIVSLIASTDCHCGTHHGAKLLCNETLDGPNEFPTTVERVDLGRTLCKTRRKDSGNVAETFLLAETSTRGQQVYQVLHYLCYFQTDH